MDGENDKQISQSVFTQAEEILTTIKTAESGTVLAKGFLDTPVAKAIRGTIDEILSALGKRIVEEDVVVGYEEDPPNIPEPITEERDVVRDEEDIDEWKALMKEAEEAQDK